MSDNDDSDIKFRDQCAIQVMGALLNQMEFLVKQHTGYKSTPISKILMYNWEMDQKDFEQTTDRLARFSYKIADSMRKARLASFK